MLEEFVSMMDVILMGLLIAPYLILSGIIGYLLYRIEKNEKPLEKNDTNLKLTKDRFSTWGDIEDEDYEQKFDDELIISVKQGERSRDIADYILQLQDDVEWHVKQAKLSNERIVKYRTRITQLESYHKAVRLTCEHCDDCKCFKI